MQSTLSSIRWLAGWLRRIVLHLNMGKKWMRENEREKWSRKKSANISMGTKYVFDAWNVLATAEWRQEFFDKSDLKRNKIEINKPVDVDCRFTDLFKSRLRASFRQNSFAVGALRKLRWTIRHLRARFEWKLDVRREKFARTYCVFATCDVAMIV